MQNTVFGQAQDFLSKANDLGLIAEINERLEQRNHERRKELIAGIKNIKSEKEMGLPELEKACGLARTEFEKAQEALRLADRKYKELSVRGYGLRMQYEGQRSTIENEIMELAPEFLKRAYINLDYLQDQMRNKLSVWIAHKWTPWNGSVSETKSNAEDLSALRQEIDGAKKRILAMVLESAELPKLKAEAGDICVRIQKRAVALGLDENALGEWNQRQASLSQEDSAGTKKATALLSA